MANVKFSVQDLKNRVMQAVDQFLIEKPSLIELHVHEQAISHRVASYLENLFCKGDGLKADCEYDRHTQFDKVFDFDPNEYEKEEYDEYKRCDCKGCEKIQRKERIPEKLFRPDVVMHSRGNDYCNLIAMEIKKDKLCLFDTVKLKAMTKLRNNDGQYEYQLGVFLYFPKGKPEYIWF